MEAPGRACQGVAIIQGARFARETTIIAVKSASSTRRAAVRFIRVPQNMRMLHVNPVVHAPITESPDNQEKKHESPFKHDSDRRGVRPHFISPRVTDAKAAPNRPTPRGRLPMSPPLIDTENPKVATTPQKSRKGCSEKQLQANRENAKRSRGPVTPEGKERSKYNARKHDLRAESPVLPGENAAELIRRLEVWPMLMNAATELEWFAAERAVHMGWRIERAERSEDAAAERVMIDLEKATEDRQAEEARLLGLELDSDVDPAGVIRKLQRTPEGCLALLGEWTSLQIQMDVCGVLFWSRRERLFHILGKRLRDLFTDDPVITRWVVAMMGAVYGDSEGDKAQEIGDILEGLRPDWMGEEEFRIRMRVMAGWLPGKQEAAARVSAYVAAAIADLNERLERARANTRHELKLDCESAWVDDSAAGARRTSYKLGHDRSFHAALRRLEALQKARRAGGETMADDLDDETEPAGTIAAAPGPAAETTTELPVTNERISAPADAFVPVTYHPISPIGPGHLDHFTNEPILAAPADAFVPLTNDPISPARPGGLDSFTNEPNLPRAVDRPGDVDSPVRRDPVPCEKNAMESCAVAGGALGPGRLLTKSALESAETADSIVDSPGSASRRLQEEYHRNVVSGTEGG
jgi:hypothetical protein